LSAETLTYFPLLKEKVKFRMFELNYQPSRTEVEVTLLRNSLCPVGVQMYRLIKLLKTSATKSRL